MADKHESVLIIDDDRNFSEGCRRSLADAGFEVEVSNEAREGVARAKKGKFDVVLLDLKMPDENGVQVLNRFQHDLPHVPVVIVTGYATVETAVQTFKMGAVEFLSKPFAPDEMLEAISRAIVKKSPPQQVQMQAAAPAVSLADKMPAEVAKGLTEKVGPAKMSLPWHKAALLGILAGAYIGFGGVLATLVGSDAASFVGVGLSKIAAGLVFSVGLILVVVAGAELFTGNNLMFMSVLDRPHLLKPMVAKWGAVYLANFIGGLLIAGLMAGSGLWKVGNAAFGVQALKIASAKVDLSFAEALFRGIGCNWLVCLAVWMALASQQIAGKILAIVFPITAFVAIGFEHCVANMYFIPLGMMLKGTDLAAKAGLDVSNLTVKGFVVDNLFPVTVGNVIGGAIFVGMVYWLTFVRQSK